MGYLPPLPSTGIALPDPLTIQAFATTDVNSWFTTIDAHLVALELRAGSGGTASQRDTAYGVPATMADRVALHNKAARWNRTENQTGWTEQYFAAGTDTGQSAPYLISTAPAGWYPVSGNLPEFISTKASFGTVSGATTPLADSARVDKVVNRNIVMDAGGSCRFVMAGRYEVTYSVEWVTVNASGQRNITESGTGTVLMASASYMEPSTLASKTQTLQTTINCLASQYISPTCTQNSGSSLNAIGYVRVKYTGPPTT